jgi:phosphatidylinositol alpha-1,6-mannosyltransferase
VAVSEVPLHPIWRFLLSAAWVGLRIARHERPQVVLAGSGLTAPIVWLAGSIAGACRAAYVHGLDVVAPSRLYRWLWLPALRRMDRVIANSRATAVLAERAGIEKGAISVVHPGVELPKHDPDARARFRARHDLHNEPVLLSVGRLTTRKGLREFVAEVLPKIVQEQPNVVLLVVGDVPAQALFAEAQTPESILQAAKNAGVGTHVRFLGALFGQDLADAYAGADVHVFPVREIPNDPEGFGMVAVEAAAHGLPTVSYATGGVVDAVREGISGRLVRQGDNGGFAGAALTALRDYSDPTPIRDYAAEFVWLSFGANISRALSTRHVGSRS